MPVELQDILKANLVLAGISLLNDEDERNSFSEAIASETSTEILVPATPPFPLPGGPPTLPEPGMVLSLHRDRIRIASFPSRTLIEKEYPTLDELTRLAEVADLAIAKTHLMGRVPRAFGYNVELVYGPEPNLSSSAYIAGRLYGDREFGNEGWALVGGSGRLIFTGAGAAWTVAVEPRANDPTGKRVFLSLNLHREEQRIPGSEEILGSLQEVWNQAHAFAIRLDEGA